MPPASSMGPEVAAALAAFPADFGVLGPQTLLEIRRFMAAVPQPALSGRVDITERVVAADGDQPAITMRVHRPHGLDGALPAIVWMHGGGLVLGSAIGDDIRFDRWCPDLDVVGVSVDYRLAPEVPYPGPIEDCYRALVHVYRHAAELGVDPQRIGIGGASAGGGLAASLALLARDRGEVPVAFQLLIYPMLDDRQVTPSSQWDAPVWPPSANTFGWLAYLGEHKNSPELSPYAAAARATDLAGLPPAHISVGGLDGFVDEDVDYALRLNQAGVPVELHVYPHAPHGFDSLAPGTALARRARMDMETWLAAQLAR